MAEATEQTTALAHLSRARAELAEAKSVQEIHHFVAMGEAARAYAKQKRLGRDAVNDATEFTIEAERLLGLALIATKPQRSKGRMGQLAGKVKGTGRGRGGAKPFLAVPTGDRQKHDDSEPTLEEMGISKKESSRAQKLAAMPQNELAAVVEKVKSQGELSVRKVIQQPHVTRNSGELEWYTPASVIDLAREVLGAIDLDPSSNSLANETVQAARFFGVEDDGLKQPWHGRVFMNPPYKDGLIGPFCDRLLWHWLEGKLAAAVVYVNNATETKWGQALLSTCSAVCFPSGRISCIRPDGTTATPLQGQMILYFGSNVAAFKKHFASLGTVLHG